MRFIFPDNIDGWSSLLKIISPEPVVTSMLVNDTHLSTLSGFALEHAMQPHRNKFPGYMTSHCLMLKVKSEPATGTPAIDPQSKTELSRPELC